MKARPALLFAASFAAAQGADERWATVPANPAAPVATALIVADAPDESWVRLVGGNHPLATSPIVRPVRAVAVDLPPAASAVPAEEPAASVPPTARWPDPNGRIVEAPADGAGDAAAGRNPWLPQPKGSGTRRTETYVFGGYIAGGPGGPVGLVNGRSVHAGERVGSFVVERILGPAVVLERRGALYVLPRGVRTAIDLLPS